MALGLDVLEAARHPALRVDDVGVATGDVEQLELRVAGQRAVGLGDLLLGVREHREGQVVLLREAFLGVDAVDADADHRGVGAAEREDVVADLAGLGGAARRAVLRVEVEHDPLAAVVGERAPLAGLVLQLEGGRSFADSGRGAGGGRGEGQRERGAESGDGGEESGGGAGHGGKSF